MTSQGNVPDSSYPQPSTLIVRIEPPSGVLFVVYAGLAYGTDAQPDDRSNTVGQFRDKVRRTLRRWAQLHG